mmetsp:Transcript_446/g.706  ORF Transcript_446/g.706 Transcript_446/m.706 type:complete len:84 (-) Transcript_446:443-694(-)|eukprot:CAMPEP_0119022776 /NCGR_PEP_ID=MMETSP1176-20130426/28729_1 /TAXON_ID=265551 /ORGANISM="Synedropsis recta cf, Strain CCMP1620" /LENGTH=83 /DNA_ID=CAMNT_0006977713 /DNA_START=348 /DNA_END=599 /DNA_ORIENTATION=-
MFLALSENDERVTLKEETLASFLQSKQGKVESLEWFMEDYCWDKTRWRMTDEGRVLKELQEAAKRPKSGEDDIPCISQCARLV